MKIPEYKKNEEEDYYNEKQNDYHFDPRILLFQYSIYNLYPESLSLYIRIPGARFCFSDNDDDHI